MAFTMPNVVFSWVVGAVLVALGMIGRKQHPTGASLSGSHVEREGSAAQVHINPVAAAELAEAERALALHHATEEQIERLHDADRYGSAAERGLRMAGVGSPSRVAVGVAVPWARVCEQVERVHYCVPPEPARAQTPPPPGSLSCRGAAESSQAGV